MLVGERHQLVAVVRHQGFVGGDDVLAVGDRTQHHLATELLAAGELDNDLDVRVVDGLEQVSGERQSTGVAGACLAEVPYGSNGRLDGAAGAAGDLVGVAGQHVDGSLADGAEPDDGDLDGLHAVRDRPRLSDTGGI